MGTIDIKIKPHRQADKQEPEEAQQPDVEMTSMETQEKNGKSEENSTLQEQKVLFRKDPVSKSHRAQVSTKDSKQEDAEAKTNRVSDKLHLVEDLKNKEALASNSNSEKVVVVRGLTKKFTVGESEIQVLDGIDLEIDQGDFAMLVGPSGCGKSTLLHIIYGLEAPTKGEVFIKGTDIWSHTKNWRADFRNSSVGFIPQQAFWLKALSVLENVAVPSIIGGLSYHKGLKRAAQMLELVEMSDWGKHRPYDLSGGQQQRIALARALLLNPWFIIADEPTGNLDQRSGVQLMDLIKSFNERFKITVLMVTHNPKQYKYATKVFEMLDGKISGFTKQ